MNKQIMFMLNHLKEMRQLAQHYMNILGPVAAGSEIATERYEILSDFVFKSYNWERQFQAKSLKLNDKDIDVIDNSVAVLTTMEAYYKQFRGDDLLNFVMLNNAIGRAVTLL